MAFVIKEDRPGRKRLLVLSALLLWAGSAWLAYETGWKRSGYNNQEAHNVQQALESELAAIYQVKNELESRVSILQTTARVDREAKEELARELKSLRDVQAELKEEIAFYKSIISPPKGSTGLGIYSMKIYGQDDQIFHYKLVLTQSGKNDSLAEGVADVRLKGVLQGEEKELSISEIGVAATRQLSYKFRYFEELSGSLKLPDGYMPREVVVILKPSSGKKSKKPIKSFDWQSVRRTR